MSSGFTATLQRINTRIVKIQSTLRRHEMVNDYSRLYTLKIRCNDSQNKICLTLADRVEHLAPSAFLYRCFRHRDASASWLLDENEVIIKISSCFRSVNFVQIWNCKNIKENPTFVNQLLESWLTLNSGL